MPRLDPIHPLLDPRSLPTEAQDAWRSGSIERVVATLRSERGGRLAWGPYLDPRGDGPAALERLRSLTSRDTLSVAAQGVALDVPWGEARRWLITAATRRRRGSRYVDWSTGEIRWERVRSDLDSRVPGRVSVVIPTFQDWCMTLRTVDAVLASTDLAEDLEILVVDNGSDPEVAHALAAKFLGRDGIALVRLDTNQNFAGGSNVGMAVSSGELVLFLNNDTEVRPGWLAPLRERIASPAVRGVQPLLVYPDGTIQAAGTVFPVKDALPIHFVTGHPMADAARAGTMRFAAITAAAMLMRAREIAELEGFDPVFANGMEDVDLCLRAVEAKGGHFAVAPASVVVHHEGKSRGRSAHIPQNRRTFLERWRGRLPEGQISMYQTLGLEVAHLGAGPGAYPAPRPLVVRPPRAVRLDDGSRVPVLRWCIKSPAASGGRDGSSGAHATGHLLETILGAAEQEVVVLGRGAHAVPATALDDVSLVVRGDERGWAQPGKINVLVLDGSSGPVDDDELAEFDLVLDLGPGPHSGRRRATETTRQGLVPDVLALHAARTGPVAGPEPGHGSGSVRIEVREPERMCVYSGLFGSYERLTPQPAFAGDAIDKILFTDDPALRSEDWEVRVVAPALRTDPGRSARRVKIMAHERIPDYSTSLYIDNSVQLKVAPSALLVQMLAPGERWAGVKHGYRGPVQEEAAVLLKMPEFDRPERVAEQVEHYRKACPEALAAQTLWSAIIARRHLDPVVREVQVTWWEQVLRYSRRDQLSLPYALLSADLVPRVHTLDPWDSPYHRWPISEGRDRARALGPVQGSHG